MSLLFSVLIRYDIVDFRFSRLPVSAHGETGKRLVVVCFQDNLTSLTARFGIATSRNHGKCTRKLCESYPLVNLWIKVIWPEYIEIGRP